MANHENNFKPLTTSEARERGRAGGKKSVARRKEKRALKEIFSTIMKEEISETAKKDILKNLPKIIDNFISVKFAIACALVEKALKGDVKAFELIRDTIGEKAVEPQEEAVKEGPSARFKHYQEKLVAQEREIKLRDKQQCEEIERLKAELAKKS